MKIFQSSHWKYQNREHSGSFFICFTSCESFHIRNVPLRHFCPFKIVLFMLGSFLRSSAPRTVRRSLLSVLLLKCWYRKNVREKCPGCFTRSLFILRQMKTIFFGVPKAILLKNMYVRLLFHVLGRHIFRVSEKRQKIKMCPGASEMDNKQKANATVVTSNGGAKLKIYW